MWQHCSRVYCRHRHLPVVSKPFVKIVRSNVLECLSLTLFFPPAKYKIFRGSKMAIHIQNGKGNTNCDMDAKVQSLPFKIHADCDAKVAKYFDKYVKGGESEVLNASFRGFPLKGKTITVPEGYKGLVLHESIQPITDKDERKFYVTHNFNSIVYWNWDKEPSRNDTFIQALDWIDIAEGLHSPINESTDM